MQCGCLVNCVAGYVLQAVSSCQVALFSAGIAPSTQSERGVS